MSKVVQKSLARKVRKLWDAVPVSWRPHFMEMAFEVGKLAAGLLPYWMESEYSTFDAYLYHACGFSLKGSQQLATITLTYYEIPSLEVWKQVGWARAAQAAQRNQEDRNQRLLESGSNVLDVLTLI